MLASYNSAIRTTYKLPRPPSPSTPSTFEGDFGFVLMTSSWNNWNISGNLEYNARGRQCRQAMQSGWCGGISADLIFCYFLVKQKVEEENLTRRGFTGHEHYPQFKIINMNGRLYDPVICRFFSPDNFVQLPEFSQSYNRYSYCLNNPLKYTDPSGQTWYEVDGNRKFIDDGDYYLTIYDVSQREFNRLLRRFNRDEDAYSKYRNKLADKNEFSNNTIFGNFSEFSQNGDGTKVLPGVEVKLYKPNGIPHSDRQILGQWNDGKPTETILNGKIYVVHNSTEKYIDLTDKSLQREFDRTFRQQPGISNIAEDIFYITAYLFLYL